MSGDTAMMVAVQRYLDDRRQLGFELIAPGTELMRFARYADARNHRGPLTQDLIVGWAREHVKRTSAVTAARRLECVRPFAAYYRQFEPTSEIPPLGILGRGHRRLVPHIYTDQEVAQLLQASDRLTPHDGLRPLAYRTLFGLIAAAGLRLSEALNLTVADVDLAAGAVTIRQTKFRKSRCLPIHSSVVRALRSYRQSRDRCHDFDPWLAVLRVPTGHHTAQEDVENVFLRMQPHLGWQARGDYPVPRIHDLRHTFAVRRLQRWREEDQSIDQALFWLCTYLGHAKDFQHVLVPHRRTGAHGLHRCEVRALLGHQGPHREPSDRPDLRRIGAGVLRSVHAAAAGAEPAYCGVLSRHLRAASELRWGNSFTAGAQLQPHRSECTVPGRVP